VCSLRQSHSWECQSHPPFTLSYYQPPHPQKGKTPQKPKQGNSLQNKNTLFWQNKIRNRFKALPPFFFLLLLLLRLGHHLHGFNNSRAEVPSKTPATRKANYGRTKYQNLLSTAAEERRGEVGSK
jgi:hypothetical protein